MANVIKYIINYCLRIILVIFRIFPIDNSKVILMSFGGKGLSDNPRYVAERLAKDYPQGKYIWLAKNMDEEYPEYITKVKIHSLRSMYELATAKVWYFNSRVNLYMIKRKGQTYIQTWHGGISVKKIGNAVNNSDFLATKRMQHDIAITDVMISSSGFGDKVYQKDFGFNKEILKHGYPRLDILFNATDEDKALYRKKIGIKEGAKVVFYAPTFRDDQRTDVYDLDYDAILKALESKWGGEWVFVTKFHPVMRNADNLIPDDPRVIDARGYDDTYEIMAVSDCLITDYSSVMFEMGMVHKPVFLYQKDYQDYCAGRGLYFTREELPFPNAQDNDKLIENIAAFDAEPYVVAVDKLFKEKIEDYDDGRASERTSRYIVDILQGK